MMDASEIEISLVIPCLNEAETLAGCLEKAKEGLREYGTSAEMIVADNGSTDGSVDIARRFGATVVNVEERGYGSALMGGINCARGRFIVMGDADNNHDLTEIPKFVSRLREGFDLVQGCRFESGGGTISSGSMSFVRRHIGNPLLSLLARVWFKVSIHDINCGFRGFTRSLYDRLDLQCTGMEFSPEMIIKASFQKAKVFEIPITHYPDGRTSQTAHNRTIRDGWRTLRFFLMYSPRWLFLIPGLALLAAGSLIYIAWILGALPNDLTSLIQLFVFAGLAILCGYQSILFAVFTKVFATRERLLATNEKFERLFEVINLERALAVSALSIVCGIVFLGLGLFGTQSWGAGALYLSFIGATAIAIGFQTVLSGFFLSILGLKRK
jgi:glycosyltransferase involved in cell wall biosynthesis